MSIPHIKVGIISSPKIEFKLFSNFKTDNGEQIMAGNYTALLSNNAIELTGNGKTTYFNNNINLIAENTQSANFEIIDVIIGVNFHWERKENQSFAGNLTLKIIDNQITAINEISVEEYLRSVISSEMSATSSTELLKAHAVISRSWLLAQIEKNKQLEIKGEVYNTTQITDDEIIKWYDREDHKDFDVCADDHCQRYQGVTRETVTRVSQAVDATKGQVLMYNHNICDARFSKCCGGVSERFENAWEPVNHPYLEMVIDNPSNDNAILRDLTNETEATEFITTAPPAFCNTNNKQVLSDVLNDYDQETNNFYRWQVQYKQDELSELIKSRLGIDFGTIIDLIPIERGVSSRLIKLKVVGTKKTMTIGKELEIRKMLSKTHLYSSAFIINKTTIDNITYFELKGAGWGHGIGLCQIGAAVMGHQGYSYEQILEHYFKGATIEKRY